MTFGSRVSRSADFEWKSRLFFHVTIVACNKIELNTRLLDPGGEISHDNYEFWQKSDTDLALHCSLTKKPSPTTKPWENAPDYFMRVILTNRQLPYGIVALIIDLRIMQHRLPDI